MTSLGVVVICKLYILTSLWSNWIPNGLIIIFLPPSLYCIVLRIVEACVRGPEFESWLSHMTSHVTLSNFL